jgi:hypothetical protein
MALVMFFSQVSRWCLVVVYRRAKTLEGAAKAAVAEPGATPAPEVMNMALTTIDQTRGAKAVLPERNHSRLRTLVQEMQGFCDLWEGDLKRVEQSDSNNVKLQQEVYDLLDIMKVSFDVILKCTHCLLRSWRLVALFRPVQAYRSPR